MEPELFILAVLLLLLGTVIPLAAVGKDRRLIRTSALLCTIAASAILIVLALVVLITSQGFSWTAYQPFELFSIAFVIDRLAAFFLLIIAVVSLCVAIYSGEYIEHLDGGSRRNLLCGCANLFIFSMVLVVASSNTLSFLS